MIACEPKSKIIFYLVKFSPLCNDMYKCKNCTRLFFIKARVRVGEVCAHFADGIDETEGTAEVADAFIETQPNDDWH